MKALIGSLFLALSALAQPVPLNQRVLVIVNDRSRPEPATGGLGASLWVGQYYAAKRGIPAANIFHVKTTTDEAISLEDYKAQIETPLRKFLDAHDGAMRSRILYLVPTYGVPVRIAQSFAVDSVLSVMYLGHDEAKPPLRNPYHAPPGSRPPHFDAWSDRSDAAGGWKMFLVTRLDGPSAAIARGLVDKALAAEPSLTLKSGVAYFDMQGTREPKEWQYAIDEEIQQAAETSQRRGFETVLHVQRDALCRCPIAPAAQYYYDAAAKNVMVDPMGVSAGVSFPVEPLEEGDFTVRLHSESIQNIGNGVTLTLDDGGRNSIRLSYPLIPFHDWNASDDVALEKTVNGTATAQATLRVDKSAATQNDVTELRLSVRKDRIAAWRNGAELLSAADAKATGLRISRVTLEARCWNFRLLGFDVSAAGRSIWHDDFAADTTARYTWNMPPLAAPNALWAWGWYTQAWDSYRFVPGAVGAHLTSFTAIEIRTPVDSDPRLASVSNKRWGGNWVPRMLEEGVTATWGAVAEPYATLYAPGGNVFDHLWAGYNFAESFYIAEPAVRWVMVAIGDPLYAPAAFAAR